VTTEGKKDKQQCLDGCVCVLLFVGDFFASFCFVLLLFFLSVSLFFPWARAGAGKVVSTLTAF